MYWVQVEWDENGWLNVQVDWNAVIREWDRWDDVGFIPSCHLYVASHSQIKFYVSRIASHHMYLFLKNSTSCKLWFLISCTVAEPGEGLGGGGARGGRGAGPKLIFRPNWGPRGCKKSFLRPLPNAYLKVWMTWFSLAWDHALSLLTLKISHEKRAWYISLTDHM